MACSGEGARSGPTWLFQFTLEGGGIFERRGTRNFVKPGCAFCAKIPSPHRYYRDAESAEWRFFWIIVNHAYVVDRLARQPDLTNVVMDCREAGSLIEAALALLFAGRDGADAYEREAKLFLWMLELERHAFFQRHPMVERTRLLDFVRHRALRRLDQFLSVDELAREWGMTRSNFAHHFRKVTGQAPATCIRHIRIQEAARLMQEGRWSVKEVAAKTGFSDANHLCKCFRAHLQISPGNYRRVMAKRELPLEKDLKFDLTRRRGSPSIKNK